MKKLTICLLFVLLAGISNAGLSHANVGSDSWINEDVKLTDEQKLEMAQLQKNILDQKIQVVNKYVEYGVLPEQKAKKIISKFEKHYNKMEENGFIPKWDKHKKRHKQCNCDTSDEE